MSKRTYKTLGNILLIINFILLPALNAQTLEKTTIQFKWFHQFQFAGYYAAVEKGFYAEEGLDVELRERDVSTSHIDDVLKGKAEYGVADAGLVLSRLNGNPVVLLDQIFQHSPLIFLTLKKSGIRTAYDLKTKKIMLDKNGDGDAPLNAMLHSTFGKINDLETVPSSFNYNDLIDGKIDAMSAYITDQPFWFRKNGVEVISIDPRDYGVDFYGDNLFTTKQEINSNPDRVERMRRATLKGWQYAMQHTDEIIEIILQKYNSQKLSREHLVFEAAETKKMIVSDFIELGSYNPSRYQKTAEIYADLGLAKNVEIDKGFFYSENLEPSLILTKKEQKWVSQHPVIEYTGDPNFLPFEGSKDGKHIGIASDYVKEVQKLTGLQFKYNPSKTWIKATQKAKENKVLMLVESTDTPLDLHFTTPIVSSLIVMVMRDDASYVHDLNSLSDQKIATVKDYGYVVRIKKDFPDLDYYDVADIQDGLAAVSTGKYDVFLCSFALASYTISEMGLHNIKIVGKTHIDMELAFGFTKRSDLLVGIINKAMNAVEQKRRLEISQTWVPQKYVEKIDYTLVFNIIFIAILILLLVVYWNRKLRNEIRKKEEAENMYIRLSQDISGRYTLFSHTGKEGKLTSLSKGFENLSNANRESFIGQNWASILNWVPEDKELTAKKVEEMLTELDGTKEYEFEMRFIDDNNIVRTVYIIQHLVMQDNKLQYVDGLAEDITEKKEAAKQLKIAKEKTEEANQQLKMFKMLSEASGQGIGTANIKDRSIYYMNPQLKKMCGVDDWKASDERDFIQFYTEQAQEKFNNVVMPAIMEDGHWTGELELLNIMTGQKIPTIENFFIVKDEKGNPLFISDVATDISEQKNNEELLRQSDDRFQQSLKFATIGAWDWNIVTGELYWSDQIAPLFGYKTGELETSYENFIGAVHPDDREMLQKAINDCVENNIVYEIEHRVVWPDGTVHWLLERGDVTRDRDGIPTHMLGVVQDITESKNIMVELEHAREESESANRAKSMFLANMSHEIRTPMNAIIGMLYLVQKTKLNDAQTNYVSKAHYAAESLLVIINDILDFSKIEAGKFKLENIDFELEDVMSNVSNVIGYNAKEKNIEFLIDYDTNIPKSLVGDSLRLAQVLINLANNAVKFTDEGNVIITQKLLEEHENSVNILFCIKDEGIGISEDEQKKLFNEFTQVDGSITRKYGGTGLGLTISKKFVELMNGRIWIENSEIGKGSTFCITVELDKSTNLLEKHLSAKSLPEVFGTINILVVDDNQTAQEITSSMLQSFNFNVEMVSSAKEAIDLLENSDETRHFELVFMDWKMPNMNGMEASVAIRNNKKIFKQPKIVMLTAYDTEELKSTEDIVELDTIISKPVSPSVLYDVIMEVFGYSISKHIQHDEIISLESILGAKVLLAEDNELNQEFAVSLLSNNGILVDVADDGEMALQMAQENRYDAILMDIQMPKMDGITATERIRQLAIDNNDKYYETLPIIAMTAHALTGDKEKSLLAGMNEHVTKPIDPNRLFKVLIKFIEPRKNNRKIKTIEKKENSSVDIDFSMLEHINFDEAIYRLSGDKKAYKNILLKFKDKYAGIADEIQRLANEEGISVAEEKSHELKGIAGSIGAHELFEITKEVDDILKNDKLPSEELYSDLKEKLSQVCNSIVLFETSLDDIKVFKVGVFDSIKAKKLLIKLQDALENDIVVAENIISQLEPIMASSSEYEKFKNIYNKVIGFEIDEAKKSLASFIKELDLVDDANE